MPLSSFDNFALLSHLPFLQHKQHKESAQFSTREVAMNSVGSILVTDYGNEYRVHVQEPFLGGTPKLIVSKKTTTGWEYERITPIETLRARALAIRTISDLFSKLSLAGN